VSVIRRTQGGQYLVVRLAQQPARLCFLQQVRRQQQARLVGHKLELVGPKG
jgi:hypothetical protein